METRQRRASGRFCGFEWPFDRIGGHARCDSAHLLETLRPGANGPRGMAGEIGVADADK
jgi:hypothetical protein